MTGTLGTLFQSRIRAPLSVKNIVIVELMEVCSNKNITDILNDYMLVFKRNKDVVMLQWQFF